MRTTLSIADELLAAAKERARAQGRTLGELVEAALRRELASRPAQQRRPVPVLRGGTGPRPGLDLTSNAALHEALDEGHPLDGLR
ncbi:MAG TPA: ribbon-helix-helix protein, CopG family [Mycobacteriales bacterium]|nr:ribbon-helix-helix protein, CopG family [Mycobacteriales bacterium]